VDNMTALLSIDARRRWKSGPRAFFLA